MRHPDGDPLLGQPFCLDCYDHTGQVVWNAYVAELWRRTLLKVNKALKRYGARASFAKVAEMQARGVVHLHALIRLDALHPALVTDEQPDATARERRPGGARTAAAVGRAAAAAPRPRGRLHHHDLPDPAAPRPRATSHGWLVAWGEQLDIRVVRDPAVTAPSAVAR